VAGLYLAGAAGVSALALLTAPASAQTVITPLERPDPASITVPDMASFKPTPLDIRRFEDYFYFHKDGVSYERAFADLDQCRGYGMVAHGLVLTPTVVPLGGPLVKDAPKLGSPMGGFISYVLVNMIVASYLEDLGQGTIRRCMMWKGYSRYGTSRALWKEIEKGNDAAKLARQALLASGLKPATTALDP
jgi:hypothetical protein